MLRRNFLKLTGLGAGAVVALPALGFAATSYEEAMAGLIKNEIGYLTLDPAGLEKFIKDYSEKADDSYRLKVKAMYLLGISPEQSFTVNEIVRAYLMSSDFFMNQMNESKTVKYIGLYNPYVRPCAHPFSFLYFPAVTT